MDLAVIVHVRHQWAFSKCVRNFFIRILRLGNNSFIATMAFRPISQRDLLIYNQQLSFFSYPIFAPSVILWVAEEAEERGDDKRDGAGVAEKRKTLSMRAGVILSGSRKSISASLISVTCVCQIDVRVPFADRSNYHLHYCK